VSRAAEAQPRRPSSSSPCSGFSGSDGDGRHCTCEAWSGKAIRWGLAFYPTSSAWATAASLHQTITIPGNQEGLTCVPEIGIAESHRIAVAKFVVWITLIRLCLTLIVFLITIHIFPRFLCSSLRSPQFSVEPFHHLNSSFASLRHVVWITSTRRFDH
jgi:hypothetical protein